MLRRKVSTILDDALFRRAKLESVRQGKKINQIVAEALEAYLDKGGRHASAGVVAESWGSVGLDKKRVRKLLLDEDGLLDA
jgi:hypothetical protein